MRASNSRRALFVLLVVALMVAGLSVPAHAEADGAPGADPALYAPPFELVFPVEGRSSLSSTFGAIRDGGSRLHRGIDISAPKTTPVLAAADGVISRLDVGEKAGLFVEIRHAEGWHTLYLHLNDDEPPAPPPPEPVCEVVTVEEPPAEEPPAEEPPAEEPPTEEPPAEEPPAEEPPADDAPSEEPPAEEAPAEEPPVEEVVCEEPPIIEEPLTWGTPPEVFVGARVAAGDTIGFVGTSGNASSNAPHLHFEIRMSDGTSVNPHPVLSGRSSVTTLYVVPEITDDPVTSSIDVVGHVDPTGGFNADIWVHRGVAYLSTFGRDNVCPASGVRRYDVTDPAEPVELASISQDYPGSSTEAVWAGSVETDRFSGDLAVVAHQLCDPDRGRGFRGLALYDVTDPSSPLPLGTYETGTGTLGVHSFDVWVEEDRVLVVAAAPNSFLDHPDALGDVRIVDITDPENPVAVADWDFRRDATVTVREAVLDGVDPRDLRVQGITMDPDGERAFVAHWNAGVVVLDLSDPLQPEAIGRTSSLGYQEGKSSSTAYDPDTGVLTVNHRDVDPLEDEIGAGSWGISVVFDASGGGDPSLGSVYSIVDALADDEGRLALGGLYSAHESVITDGYLYAVWLSGGLRVVDLSDPTEFVEIASFIPPTRVDPQDHFASPNGNIGMPLAWSVHVVDNLIYVSDLNTGLWILRLTEPPLGID